MLARVFIILSLECSLYSDFRKKVENEREKKRQPAVFILLRSNKPFVVLVHLRCSSDMISFPLSHLLTRPARNKNDDCTTARYHIIRAHQDSEFDGITETAHSQTAESRCGSKPGPLVWSSLVGFHPRLLPPNVPILSSSQRLLSTPT
mmetsp:Transcript_54068/g.114833  ORF Transcript_54068/g.114833 Transcript_54068/m.114833 type:complete len:148 (+) Transcript_54068:1373-1816(+)